jgi:hypothetical protein
MHELREDLEHLDVSLPEAGTPGLNYISEIKPLTPAATAAADVRSAGSSEVPLGELLVRDLVTELQEGLGLSPEQVRAKIRGRFGRWWKWGGSC